MLRDPSCHSWGRRLPGLLGEGLVGPAEVVVHEVSHANQMLVALGEQGLIYKNRFGKYAFAVPLLGKFIHRTFEGRSIEPPLPFSR